MTPSSPPAIVTLVASPPPSAVGSTSNEFIDDALQVLNKNAAGNRIARVSCVRDIDLELGKLAADHATNPLRLQIVGHSISGLLSLGASWIPESDMMAKAFRYPYYVVDTNPASLGLLSKYAGKIDEVMLVGCNIGSASSFGYAINGRTLTYTLSEMLRCLVRGADDVVSPDEFDAHGWYTPDVHHRKPKGWRWTEAGPPVWTDPGLDPVAGSRAMGTRSFEIRAITGCLLPVPAAAKPTDLGPGIHITCQSADADIPRSALPELSVATDQGPAQLLCGGRFLQWMDTYYLIDPNPHLSATLTAVLWGAGPDAGRSSPTPQASAAGFSPMPDGPVA